MRRESLFREKGYVSNITNISSSGEGVSTSKTEV